MESKKAVVCSNVPWSSASQRMLPFEARMLMLPCVCIIFFQSEVDFDEVAREKVKFAERYIMEAKKA